MSKGELTLRTDRYALAAAPVAWRTLAAGRAAGRVVLEVAVDR
ncbi:hypothetical protein [Spirillospora sp. NPDC048819]